MFHPIRLQRLHLENRQELMLTEFAPGRAFPATHHLQAEYVRVEPDRFLGVGHFDHDVIASIDLYRHISCSLCTHLGDRVDKCLNRLRARYHRLPVQHEVGHTSNSQLTPARFLLPHGIHSILRLQETSDSSRV